MPRNVAVAARLVNRTRLPRLTGRPVQWLLAACAKRVEKPHLRIPVDGNATTITPGVREASALAASVRMQSLGSC